MLEATALTYGGEVALRRNCEKWRGSLASHVSKPSPAAGEMLPDAIHEYGLANQNETITLRTDDYDIAVDKL